ncbi:MAG: alpha amylase C-terminal domain-containing protein [Clostridiales bacterium]|jgi:1,4-alpha-glucan branching enzyme|nr:alpha amylase C-terminal domain-containing protein [Clostridiales bacterium]
MDTDQYALWDVDPWLAPYRNDILLRMRAYEKTRDALTENGKKSLSEIANGHLYYGFHRRPDGRGWVYREWAPAADALSLIGDFNGWDPERNPMAKNARGDWEITLDALAHGSRVKVRVTSRGKSRDRIPLYIRKVSQDPVTKDFAGQIWAPAAPYEWHDAAWLGAPRPFTPYVYEAHIGMAQNKDGIGTYAEFTQNVLPRVRDAGYNAIQLMALAEHPYYASFGYQVSNFFAPSSWFGTPDELKGLVDAAHSMGIRVLMDLVHSHAVTNVLEGINEFDGTAEQFFHAGGRGTHSAWGTKLFAYGKHEVIHFLLSNVKYWLSEFHFDGFRFDGVTSMIYLDHGLGASFDNYDKYFSPNTDFEALVYLQLANEMIHEVRPGAVTIAEDMSGMPGMCLPVADGGIGFDFRLSMGVPDFWIRTLKTQSDEQLDMHTLWHELTTRRPREKNIGYCESHDQALVGDKTLIFWLADKAMYDGMSVFSDDLAVARAVALHKMIRFVTLTLAGEGYLNFIGNEFGHPEWIDFPREGNGWSYQYAKRRWDLADRDDLRYRQLQNFDRAMLRFVEEHRVLPALDLANLWIDETGKLLAYRKAGLIFLLNFHPTRSATGYELPFPHGTPEGARYRVLFDSDGAEFGGQGRISRDTEYQTRRLAQKQGNVGVLIYTPARTALVLGPV